LQLNSRYIAQSRPNEVVSPPKHTPIMSNNDDDSDDFMPADEEEEGTDEDDFMPADDHKVIPAFKNKFSSGGNKAALAAVAAVATAASIRRSTNVASRINGNNFSPPSTEDDENSEAASSMSSITQIDMMDADEDADLDNFRLDITPSYEARKAALDNITEELLNLDKGFIINIINLHDYYYY